MLINIRGTNGSGKTTLARKFQQDGKIVKLAQYQKQLKNELEWRDVTGVQSGDYITVGSYKTAQGGLDTVPSFAIQMDAVRQAATMSEHVIFEGILASTVAGSWIDFLKEMKDKGYKPLVAYLDTPAEVCLARIKARQKLAGKERPIKEQLVLDKIRSIAATRQKFAKAGIDTVVLPYDNAYPALLKVIEYVKG